MYDISVEAGVALRDLLSLNPVIVPDTSLAPGTQLARPCYVSGAPTYFGADIAQVRSCLPTGVRRKPRLAVLRRLCADHRKAGMQSRENLRHALQTHICLVTAFTWSPYASSPAAKSLA